MRIQSVATAAWVMGTLAGWATAAAQGAPKITNPETEAPPVEAARPSPEAMAASLHAEGLLAEVRGRLDDALRLLRQAQKAAPHEEDIAFDLARVALKRASLPGAQPTLADADVVPLLQMKVTTNDARLLQAYIHQQRGERARAEERLEQILNLEPGQAEATALRAQTRARPARRGEGAFTGRGWVATQVDSNVLVLPDDIPDGTTGGARLVVGADAGWTPVTGSTQVDVLLNGQLGSNLGPDRDEVAAFDFGSLVLLGVITSRLDPVDLSVTVFGSQVVTDLFRSGSDRVGGHYLQEGGGRVQATVSAWPLLPGVYVESSYRDFIAGNVDASPNDRDGLRVAAGLVGRWERGRLQMQGFTGFQQEYTDGENFDQKGAEAGVITSWRWRDLRLNFGLLYTLRDHEIDRTDHRVEPSLGARYSLYSGIDAMVQYAFTRNESSSLFAYTRHLGQVGLEGTW